MHAFFVDYTGAIKIAALSKHIASYVCFYASTSISCSPPGSLRSQILSPGITKRNASQQACQNYVNFNCCFYATRLISLLPNYFVV